MKVIVSHDHEGRIVAIGIPSRATMGIQPRPGHSVAIVEIPAGPLHHYLVGHRVDTSTKHPRLVEVKR